MLFASSRLFEAVRGLQSGKLAVLLLSLAFSAPVAAGTPADQLLAEIARQFVESLPESRLDIGKPVAIPLIQGDTCRLMPGVLKTAFNADGRFKVLPRNSAYLAECEKEKILGLTDRIYRKTAAELGREYGAHYLSLGRIWVESDNLLWATVYAELGFVHVGSGVEQHSMDRDKLGGVRLNYPVVGGIGLVVLAGFAYAGISMRSRQGAREQFKKTLRGEEQE